MVAHHDRRAERTGSSPDGSRHAVPSPQTARAGGLRRTGIVTRGSITADLMSLGVRPGDLVMAHSSLSAVGHVIGGEQALISALQTAVGQSGTLLMPAQSWQLWDPAFLAEPEIAEEDWPAIRDALPVFDPQRAPSRTMGTVAELCRTTPDSVRSSRPHRSIAAIGPLAPELLAVQELCCPAGEQSPLSALYDRNGSVLLIGVSFAKCTALHLAEHHAHYVSKRTVLNGAALLMDGTRAWVEWNELWLDDEDFEEVAQQFQRASGLTRTGTVGRATASLTPVQPLVDFASDLFAQHR